MSKILIIAGLVFIVGCSNDSVDSFENHLSGYYKIVSINSTTGVDLNNDAIKSEDIYEEISGPHNAIDGNSISFYDFNSPVNFMEIRPLKNSTNDAKLIAINFPEQHIDRLTTGEFFLVFYLNSFINYSYDISEDGKQIALLRNNKDFIENGTLNSFGYQPNGELQLKLTKQLFDFSEHEWISVELTVSYEKIE